MSDRSIVVHSLEEARAALRAAVALGAPVMLLSAPDAGSHGGVAWFEQLIAAATAETPAASARAILDCGDAPGPVMAAIRWLGEPGRQKLDLYFSGDDATAARLADMAGQAGLTLLREVPAALDLRGARDPERTCREWLANQPAPTV